MHIPYYPDEGEITVGLLGAKLTRPCTGDQITEARFQEIERRILAIEESQRVGFGLSGFGVEP
jgi:hypothetical protein